MSEQIEQQPTFIITKQKQLKAYIDKIKDEKVVFLDTEFHRQTTYYSKLCLIQIATEDTLVAIDPLEHNLDLTILLDFLKDDSIMKVFHACKQDLEIFYHLNNRKPLKNIFDTQIAALALGLGDQIGYANLVKAILNIKLDKSQQIANWIHRPLSQEQLKYALDDVVYLKKVFYIMMKQLEKKNRLSLISEELRNLSEPRSFISDDLTLYKSIKMRDTNIVTVTMLQRMAIYREKQARAENKIRNAIIHDEFLAHCAMLKPKNIDEMAAMRSVRSRVLKKYGKDLIQIINDVRELPKEQLTNNNIVIDNQPPIIDSNVKALANLILKIKAQEHSISTKLVTNNAELSIFLSKKNNTGTKLHKSWRWDMFGKYLDALKKGKLNIGVKGNTVVFNMIEDTEAE